MQRTTVDQRITAVKGFTSKHRAGTDEQISISVQVLLDRLTAGSRISDALILAEKVFTATGRTSAPKTRIVRHFASSTQRAA